MGTCFQDGTIEFVISSDLSEVRQLQEIIESQLRKHDYEDKEIFGIRLALEEAIVNAIKHGNQLDLCKKVQIRFRVQTDRFEIGITDEGPGYHVDDLADPLAIENMERPCGRGLLLMRHYMTEVIVHPPGNHLTMYKVRQLAYRNGEKRR